MSNYVIVWRDLTALRLTLLAIFFPVFVALLLPLLFLPGYNGMGSTIYAVVVSAIAIVAVPSLLGYFAAKRINSILRVISEGEHLPGKISYAWYSLPWPLAKTPRGVLEYVYFVDGRSYTVSTQVFRTEATSGFAVGDDVTIAVKPERPNEAFIVELYRRERD